HRHGHRLHVPRRLGHGGAARPRGLPVLRLRARALLHHGDARPGALQRLGGLQEHGPQLFAPTGGIGHVAEVRTNLVKFESMGVYQLSFIQQGGNTRHEHICESLELFAGRIQPGFKERHDARVKRKAEQLAPYIEKAMAKIPPLPEMREVPEVDSYPVMMQKMQMPVTDSTIAQKLTE